jgi:hypothetical protein
LRKEVGRSFWTFHATFLKNSLQKKERISKPALEVGYRHSVKAVPPILTIKVYLYLRRYRKTGESGKKQTFLSLTQFSHTHSYSFPFHISP